MSLENSNSTKRWNKNVEVVEQNNKNYWLTQKESSKEGRIKN